MNVITQAEDLLLSRIQASTGNAVHTIASLPASWREADERLPQWRQLPLVGVAYKGGSSQPMGVHARIASQWEVVVVTDHMSNDAARLRGDAVQVGAYELLSVLTSALHGFELSNMGTLHLAGHSTAQPRWATEARLSVYVATFELSLGFPEQVVASDLDGFVTFAADWQVHGDTGAPGDKDAEVEAQDQITLPQ